MAPQAANPSTFFITSGCRERKEMADASSVSVEGGMGIGRRACRTPLEDRWGMISK